MCRKRRRRRRRRKRRRRSARGARARSPRRTRRSINRPPRAPAPATRSASEPSSGVYPSRSPLRRSVTWPPTTEARRNSSWRGPWVRSPWEVPYGRPPRRGSTNASDCWGRRCDVGWPKRRRRRRSQREGHPRGRRRKRRRGRRRGRMREGGRTAPRRRRRVSRRSIGRGTSRRGGASSRIKLATIRPGRRSSRRCGAPITSRRTT
mmetsp:Transcript_34175/g.102221  ORF Transcript_34175/g.102221 Transcript_34175/m.102221 type:complete len:206 (+) Transcript_34175:113-730(+)